MLSKGNVKQAVFCGTVLIFAAVNGAGIEIPKPRIDDQHTFIRGQLDFSKPEPNIEETINYRLPATLKPTNYDIHIQPDFETNNFTGQITISIDVLQATKQIVLHALNLDIKSVYVTGQTVQVENYELDPIREFLIVNLTAELSANTKIRLGSLFDGQMSNKIRGFYMSSYWTPDNEKRTIATTDFEPTSARQAFPCFDEPAMKATFDIVVVHPNSNDYHALSNMDIVNEAPQGAFTEVHFRKSVPMSTYLVCFIISDFVSKSKTVNVHGIGENFEIRVFSTKHNFNKIDFALETATAVTEFFVDYYQVEYPLPKLDIASVPDFASGAMENWGLITFRETSLLYDKLESSTWNKQAVAITVAHEIVHMWFGNLVTMKWWNDLWLNEGFANFMEYKGTAAIYKDWEMNDQFITNTLHGVLQFDASTASHPIIQTVESPDQITEIFDTVSYDKGASVIRMLENAVGAETFAKCVTNYLKAFKYQNAETDDFIAEMEKLINDFDVRQFMQTWTKQMGFPIIEVQRSSTSGFTITQKRFFSNIEDYNQDYNDSEFNYTWTIPLTYFTDNDKAIERIWFENSVKAVGLPVSTETKWVKFNAHQVGYYRVNYDEQTWKAIIDDLKIKPESFDISDRAHLINDIFAIADASQLSYDIAMNITAYLSKEQDFVPWYVAAAKLQALHSSLLQREAFVDYLKYARSLIKDIYQSVGWNVDADNHLKNRLRVTVLTTACRLGLPECLTEATKYFTAWLDKPEIKPAADLREIIYYFGMHQVGDEDIWEKVWNIFLEENDSGEKNKLMYGLAGVKEPWLLYRFIDLAFDERNVRRQDYHNCIKNIANNPIGEPIVWEYFRENWLALVQKLGLNDRYFGRMIPAITARFNTATKLEDMQEFFNKYPEAGAGAISRQQAIETTKFNINWLEKNEETLSAWLKEATKNI